MTIRDVMDRERAALLGESLIADPISGLALLPYAAVTEPSVLVRTPTFLRAIHPVTLESLPGRDRGMAFVQVCPSLKYTFLWVHSDNNNYRQDYVSFLKEVHKVSAELPRGLHVDHLYNRERAKRLQTPFIRLVLAEQSINTSHGASYEKLRSQSGFGRPGRDHKLDEITLMKLCGIPSPRKGQPLTAEMIAHLQQVAQMCGLRFEDMRTSVKDLLEVAAFDPRRRKPR